MSGIADADDYRALWSGLLAREETAAAERAYFHHAERFAFGARAYCRDDIARATEAFVRARPRGALASSCAFAGAEENTRLLSARFEFAGDAPFTLLTFACATRGRIRREWLFAAPAPAALCTSPPAPALPVFANGVVLPREDRARVPDEIRHSPALREIFSAAAETRWLAVHDFTARADDGTTVRCVLWRLLGVLQTTGAYFNIPGLSHFEQPRANAKGAAPPTQEWTLFDARADISAKTS